METEHTTTKGALLILGSFILIIGISLVVPAKWIGLKKTPTQTFNLGDDLTPISKLQGDTNNNKTPDWKDLAVESLGTTTEKLIKETKIDPETEKALADPNNLTASFSKNMYITSAYLKKNGNVSTTEQQKLINGIIQQEASKIEIKTYTQDDLAVVKPASETEKKKYGNALGTLMQKAISYKLVDDDLKILEEYTKTKDKTLLTSFTIKRDKLDSLIESMLKTPVPYTAVPYHLVTLNALSRYKTTLDSFSKSDTDPVRSLISYNGYVVTVKALFTDLNSIRNYFNSENIIFGQSEPGYIFTSNVQIQ